MRLISFITDPGPMRKILTHVLPHTEWRTARTAGESLPPVARPPTGPSSSRSTFDRAVFQASPDELPAIDIHSVWRHSMPRCGRPARSAVSRRARANEKNPALSVDRKHLGTSTIGPHPAQSVPAGAPRDPRCWANACRSAVGRPSLLALSRLVVSKAMASRFVLHVDQTKHEDHYFLGQHRQRRAYITLDCGRRLRACRHRPPTTRLSVVNGRHPPGFDRQRVRENSNKHAGFSPSS
jgi:hypothetical protein